MDHQTFDRLTRLFGTAASRRTAWRALLVGALLGATTRSVAAKPCADVRNSRNPRCTCGGADCEPGKCFINCVDDSEFCCTGTDQSTGRKRIICGNACCLDDGSDDPCAACPRGGPGEACLEGIAGSYRRRR